MDLSHQLPNFIFAETSVGRTTSSGSKTCKLLIGPECHIFAFSSIVPFSFLGLFFSENENMVP